MKTLILLVSASLLSGCALIEAYLLKYDPNEYLQISEIRTTAYLGKTSCDNQEQAKKQSETIANKTLTFKQFVEHLPHNDKVKAASIDLDKIAQGFKDQYTKSDKVSATFCKIKLESIEKSAESMQKIIGDKPR